MKPRQLFINYIDQIIATKKKGPKAPACASPHADRDTSALERQIDEMVGQAQRHCLYNGLTLEEIALVEGKTVKRRN